jgi:hypothetical protein
VPTLRSCPRGGCYRVVERLYYVRASRGLEDFDPFFCCAECLEDLRDQAKHDPSLAITLVEGRELK